MRGETALAELAAQVRKLVYQARKEGADKRDIDSAILGASHSAHDAYQLEVFMRRPREPFHIESSRSYRDR